MMIAGVLLAILACKLVLFGGLGALLAEWILI
jgi:hypothetical protein